jgi:glycosyltransferase involved in cell wall biosynthesis
MLVPSEVVRRSYNQAFGTDRVAIVAYRVEVPERFQTPRAAEDFARLDFMLAGPPFEGRKGHALALAAFRDFMHRHHSAAPTRYREFSLHLVGLRDDDPLSQEIIDAATDILGAGVHVYPPVPRERALEITASCNAVISCSVSETFGLSVAEAMLMHHVVLRNDTGGVDEQLRDGVNGYSIGRGDPTRFAAAIETLLNRDTTTNADLQRMGATSHELMLPFTTNRYLPQIEALPG